MKKIVIATALACSLGACTSVDRNAAVSLGTAGENATQALSTQTTAAQQTLGEIDQWWAVEGALECANISAAANPGARAACLSAAQHATAPAANPIVAQLADVIAKRKKAVDDLNQAYTVFVGLAKSNAGQDAATALQTSFTSINSFVKAAGALPGAGAVVAPISTTVEGIARGGVAIIANAEEDKQILAANGDLKTANDALYSGLDAEAPAMTSVLGTLQTERMALYRAALKSGLVAPTDILTPVFAEAVPAIHLTAPNAANADVVAQAADAAIVAQTQASTAAIPKTYTDALAALHAVSAQHDKLAKGQPLNLSEIELYVNDLQADVSQANGTPATPAKTTTK